MVLLTTLASLWFPGLGLISQTAQPFRMFPANGTDRMASCTDAPSIMTGITSLQTHHQMKIWSIKKFIHLTQPSKPHTIAITECYSKPAVDSQGHTDGWELWPLTAAQQMRGYTTKHSNEDVNDCTSLTYSQRQPALWIIWWHLEQTAEL